LPYATGFVRDPEKCNIDKPYRQPDHSRQLLTYERCLEDAECKQELERLDQRHAIGANLECVSWAGVVDMNGNVNEWVERVGMEPPNRSGLKGGWWGPVRNRCRPTVRFHKEFDYGYEAGFRCCSSIGEEVVSTRFEIPKYTVSPEQLEAKKKTKGGGLRRVKKKKEPRQPPDDVASEAASPSAAPAPTASPQSPDAAATPGFAPASGPFPGVKPGAPKPPELLPGLPAAPKGAEPSVE
jgi:hypothetical protein